MTGAERLRAQLEGDRLIVAPGAHDCISGRLIAQAGFDALYMSGAGTAAMLGYPDYGLATMTEFADNAGRLVEATALPVIADADTGFGNELNAVRTVREYESRGVAGIQLEDQAFPKKCGHLDGKQLVDADDFLDKIRAAHAARRHPAFVIIARTDARSVLGIEAAVERANLALQAGADVAFVEAPETDQEVEIIPRKVHGPCLFNLVRGGKSPVFSLDQLHAFGYRIVITPGVLLTEQVLAGEKALETLRSSRELPQPAKPVSLPELFSRFGAEAWDALRRPTR
jgi:2-methylisocitrate lyase-like PEP mutase family enzyme